MKVVILKPMKNLGKIGDVVEVKDGYGRNFLIPKNIVSRATDENLKIFEDKKHELQEKNTKFLDEAKEAAKTIEGKDFTFIRQCSDDGRLFGSVSNKEIATELHKACNLIHYSSVMLHHPIKALGVYEVPLLLHVEVVINVARSGTEAAEAMNTYKQKNNAPVDETTAA